MLPQEGSDATGAWSDRNRSSKNQVSAPRKAVLALARGSILTMKEFEAIHARTVDVYEAQANAWDRLRSRSLTEKLWLGQFIAAIAPGSEILDVGCGGGDPIAKYLIERGFALVGIDAAKAMVDLARARFPSMTWIQMDMRSLKLDRQFAGIVGWDSFFHLNPAEQRRVLGYFFTHLKPGGALLLTVGHEAGEVLGKVAGQSVYHSSLSFAEYKSILAGAGFREIEYVARDPRCGMRSILFAHRYRGERSQ